MRLFILLWLFILGQNMDKSLQQDATKCKLPTALEGTTYQTSYRNVFSPGDTLTVMCGEKYWINQPTETSAVTTCNDDGTWSIRPVCQEVICSNQRENDVNYWNVYWGQRITLGDTVRYRCRPNYKSTDGSYRAVCHRDGWRPKPLCQEIICDRLEIPNADISYPNKMKYKTNEQVNYVCNEGYKGNPTRICGENGWVGNSQCTATKCKLPTALKGTTYQTSYRNVFSPGDTLTVMCGEKYWINHPTETSAVTTCNDDGTWSIRPVCQEVICSNRREKDVEYWNVYWGQRITLGDTVRYRCRQNYKSTDGSYRAVCHRDGWRPKPLCQGAVGCGPPPFLADGDVKYETKSQYSHNERAEYMCQMYYTMEGEPYTTCINGTWTGLMRCLKPCVVNEDDIRQHNISLKSSNNKFFTHDELVEFRCARGTPVGAVAMRQRCNSGVILLPTCN
uniref:complement factor H-like n=1 Tax=Scatophagus argus TaxID=75038 RepID=UPI001ED8209C|nr:complement factor H-like [Scatophagus argus]